MDGGRKGKEGKGKGRERGERKGGKVDKNVGVFCGYSEAEEKCVVLNSMAGKSVVLRGKKGI